MNLYKVEKIAILGFLILIGFASARTYYFFNDVETWMFNSLVLAAYIAFSLSMRFAIRKEGKWELLKLLYKSTDANGEVRFHQNIAYLARFVKRENSTVRKAINEKRPINNYVVEKLDEPIKLDMPKKGQKMKIEGVRCKVINSYNKTFSVRLKDDSTRLVLFSTMKFVENHGPVYPRNNFIGNLM